MTDSVATICQPTLVQEAFRAIKGVASALLVPAQEEDATAKEAVFAAVSRARRWVDELTAGADLADITQ